MKSRILYIVCLAVTGLPPLAGAGSPPRVETVLPANTDALFVIEDAPSFLDGWSQSPWWRLWNDPDLRLFLAPLRKRLGVDGWEEVVEAATGYTLEEVMDNFTGQVALALPDLSLLGDEKQEEEEDQELRLKPMVFLATVADESIAERLLAEDLKRKQSGAKPGEKIQEREVDFQGTTLHLRRSIRGSRTESLEGWAIVDGLVVLAEPVSYLKEVVTSIQSDGDPRALVHSKSYQDVRKRIPDAHTYGFFNFLGLRGVFEEGLEDEMKKDGAPAMGVTASGVSRALALDAMRCAYFGIRIQPRETSVEYGLLYTEERGLIKLAAYLPGPCVRPSFLPPQVVSAGVARFSVPDMWGALVEIAMEVNPGIGGMIENQVRSYFMSMGVDFELDVLGSLGEDVFVAQFPKSEGGERGSGLDQMCGVSLTHPKSLARSLRSLFSSFDPGGQHFQEREYQGVTIQTVRRSDDEGRVTDISYAVTKSHLLFCVGDAATLEAVIRLMEKPGETVWDRPDLKPLLREIPRDASALGFYDVGAMIQESLNEARMSLEENEEDDEEPLVNWDADPDLDRIAAYFGPVVGAMFRTPEGIFVTTRMVHPER